MKVIINADDLGYCENRDNLTFDLIEAGKITSTTLMTVAPNFKSAVRKAKSMSDIVSVGVHLTLTEFNLISKNQIFQQYGLTNDKFAVISDFRKMNIKPSFTFQKAVYSEWRLQVERALEFGIDVSHLDSHHHVHSTWWLLPVLKRIQKEFKIRKIRSTMYRNLFANTQPNLKFMNIIRHLLYRYYYVSKTPDYFSGFEDAYLYLKDNPQFNLNATVELMCHPGNPLFESETKLLQKDWMPSFKERCNLINYNKL